MSRAKAKGRRAEHAIVKLHTDLGIEAERMPLSGSLGGKYRDDVLIAGTVRAEVKCRKNGEGFATLERWMKDCPLMFLKRDRAEPLVVMTASMYRELALARWHTIAHNMAHPTTSGGNDDAG